MKSKRITIDNEERITLQTLIAMQINQNKKYEGTDIEPCFSTEDLKELYEKIAGYKYEER